MLSSVIRALAAVVLMLSAMAPAMADTVTLSATKSGWWDDTGFHNAANPNYGVGNNDPINYRNFFVFDLSGLSGTTITSATLRLTNPSNCCVFIGDPTETYTLFDVATPIATLIAGGTGQVGIFDDLGTGASYGSRVMSAADIDTLVDVSGNATLLTALNGSLGGSFALGGAITTLRPGGGPPAEVVFGSTSTGTETRQLILTTVPEPSSLLFLGTVVAGVIGGYRQRRKSRLNIVAH